VLGAAGVSSRSSAAPSPSLSGRAEELDAALAAVAGARDGCGKLVLVHGEAGIGKTRLCQEVRARQDRRTVQVLNGRAGPGDDSVLYSALADSLRGARRSEPQVWATAGRRAGLLAAVVPELAGKGSVSGTQVDRPVVFETVLEVVEEAATDRATLWLVEDLQWADPATWDFVAYAARRLGDMSLTLVVTYRDEDLPNDLWSRLLGLGRAPDVVVLALARLDGDDTQAMIRTIAPNLPAPIVERIAARSAGNPLLVEELLVSGSDPSGAIPDIVKAAVRSRTAPLDPPALAVLEAAAALGPRLDVGALSRVAAVDPGRAQEQLAGGGLLVRADDADDAGDAGDDGPGDRLAFRHPLVWEAVYQDIPLARRRQLHAAIATTLEGRELQPEGVARHHELAGDPQAALDGLVAARKAAGRNVGRAAALALAALELARRHAGLHDRSDELARLAIGDLFLAGRWTELEPLVSRLWTERDSVPAETRAWLANVLVMDLLFLGHVARARAAADDELAQVDSSTSSGGAATGLLLGQAAFLTYFCGDFPAALARAERAVAVAATSGDAEALTRGRLVAILARRQIDGARARALADHRANTDFARQAGLPVAEANSRFVTAYTSLDHDDFAAAERVATDAGTWYAPVSRAFHGLVHVLEGRPDPAEALLARAGPEVRNGIPTLRLVADAAEAHLFLHRGELDHARQILAKAAVDSEAARIPMLRSGHAGASGWLAWEEGRLDDAAAALDESLELCLSGGGYSVLATGPLMLALQADVLVRLGRAADGQRAIERCAAADPEPDRFSVAALAAARFRLAPADDAAAASEHAAHAAPWPWLHALLGCWRGELLADPHAPADARAEFAAIGALRGVLRAEAVLRGLGKRVTPQEGDGPDQLSPRELEVAHLVAEGLTNSAIAARLFVSRATVSSHVTHILTKLGYTSRTQIAVWVAARPQVDEEDDRPRWTDDRRRRTPDEI